VIAPLRLTWRLQRWEFAFVVIGGLGLAAVAFWQAFDMRSTSIHIEPKQKFAAVRYRVDGQYHSVTSLPRDTYQAVLTRIKILSKIPIAERIGINS